MKFLEIDPSYLKYLPEDRAYTTIEAIFDLAGHKSAGRVMSVSDLSQRWEWDDIKTAKLLGDFRTGDSGSKVKYERATSEIIKYLNRKTGRRYNPKSKFSIKLIAARMREGYTVSDFMDVIDIKVQGWQNNPEYSKYLRPETLFGNKFDSYLNEPKKHAGANPSPPKLVNFSKGYRDDSNK